jgi:hypothetical protein
MATQVHDGVDEKGNKVARVKGIIEGCSYFRVFAGEDKVKDARLKMKTSNGIYVVWMVDMDKGRMMFPSDATLWTTQTKFTGMHRSFIVFYFEVTTVILVPFHALLAFFICHFALIAAMQLCVCLFVYLIVMLGIFSLFFWLSRCSCL